MPFISHPNSNGNFSISRRSFFDRVANGVQGAALAWLFSRDLYGGTAAFAAEQEIAAAQRRVYDWQPRRPQFQPKAKAVIQLFMQGGPSQMDLLDPKPKLAASHGESYFDKVAADLTGPEQAGQLFRSPFKFAQQGQSGIEVSTLLPHLAEVVDDIAVIRSMFTTHPNHEPAIFKFQSGRLIQGLPTMGSWVVYGLGSESQNLPAYVVLADPDGSLPVNGVQNWQAGLLPPVYQGTQLRSKG